MTSNKENISFRDKIATIDERGKRVWVYAKKPKGKLYNYRQILAYFLIFLLFIGPFLKINEQPILLLNILKRKFVIFGNVFWPQDFHIFVLVMLTFIVFIVLFTVVYGRVWCGWACPQTIFMEMVFRKIEFFIEGNTTKQRKLSKQPWNFEKIYKKSLKHIIFYSIAFLISNTFLAYIIGKDELFALIKDGPAEHLAGFGAIVVFSFVFYFVFAYLREQACTIICPYGRLQGVLLDSNSIIVAYDYKRGENKGVYKKNENRKEAGKGDCINCLQCVQVCPTGIDIRNGTQLECVNCTACIDACNSIMDKVGFPKGLIRYDSENGIKTGKKLSFNIRTIAYTGVLIILLGVLGFFLRSRNQVETTILRAPGMLYQEQPDNKISNLYNYIIVNKTDKNFPLTIKLTSIKGKVKIIGNEVLKAKKNEITEGTFLVYINKDSLTLANTLIKFGIYSENKLIEEKSISFIGPGK
ncbi:MAG: cytochrome c oxidase accessory protein CcoG [Chlorobi bacterium]|nr:cytochrome c oxidase accessory protein CcoG [Chlorobiota bacterium]